MSKLSFKFTKGRNAKRLAGRKGLRVIRRGVKTFMKKYNRKIIKASNTTNSSNTTSISTDNTKNRNLDAILNEKAFISLIPNHLKVDCMIHTDENCYNFTNQSNSDESLLNTSIDEGIPPINEKELNDIFDPQIEALVNSINNCRLDDLF